MSRITYLDTARGWAILFVVLGHAIQYTVPKFDDHLGFRLIYAVHMPLFMFISGYVTTLPKADWNNRLARLRSRGRQLLLPFITWLPVSFLAIAWLQRPPGFVADFGLFIQQLAQAPDAGGLWFLLVLFECQLLLLIASMAGLRLVGLIGVAMLVALNVLVMAWPASNWLGLGLLRWQFLFFLVGFLARHSGWQPPSPRATLPWLLSFLVLAAFWYRKSAVPIDLWLGHLGGGSRKLAVQGYHALTAFAGIGAIMGICATLGLFSVMGPLRRGLDALGAVSLEIYAGHYLFLYAAIGLAAAWPLDPSARILCVALAALVGAILLRQLITPLPVLRTLFYGR